MMRICYALIVLLFSIAISSCNLGAPEPIETCSDGIQNQTEDGVDCGGTCTPCPSCTDGILNQNETEIDCGGPCLACMTPPPCTPDTGSWTINGLPQLDFTSFSHQLDFEGNHKYRLQGGSGAVQITVASNYDFATSTMFTLDQTIEGSYSLVIRIETISSAYLVGPGEAFVRVADGMLSIIVCNGNTYNQNFTTTSEGHAYFPAIH